MKLRIRALLGSGLLACLLGVANSDGAPPLNELPDEEVVNDDIVGLAIFPDGETPVTDLPVKVWSVDDKRMIFRTRTNGAGWFRLPRMKIDRCYIFVGSVKIDLRILTSQKGMFTQQHDIIVVTPRKMLLSRYPEMMELLIGPLILSLPQEPNVASP